MIMAHSTHLVKYKPYKMKLLVNGINARVTLEQLHPVLIFFHPDYEKNVDETVTSRGMNGHIPERGPKRRRGEKYTVAPFVRRNSMKEEH